MHTIDAVSTVRDRAIAHADLVNFFLDVADKHHGLDALADTGDDDEFFPE